MKSLLKAFGGLLMLLIAPTLIAQPINDDLWMATPLGGSPVNVTGSNENATMEPGEPIHGEGMGMSVWWIWTAPRAGGVTITTQNSFFDTILDVFVADPETGLGPRRAINDDEDANVVTSAVRFNVAAGETFFIAVDSYTGDYGLIRLRVNLGNRFPSPPNDNFANATLIEAYPADVRGSTEFATAEAGEQFIYEWDAGYSSWWKWTSPVTARVAVDLSGSTFDTLLGVYTGTSPENLSLVGRSDDGWGSWSFLKFSATAGTTYYFAVDGYEIQSGTVHLAIRDGAPEPAPAWQITDLDRNLVSSTSLKGKVYLLNFWATWSEDSDAEVPALISLHNQYKDAGLVVVGASVDDEELVVRSFYNSRQLTYPAGLSSLEMQEAFGGVASIPMTFLVDREGLIQEQFEGAQTRAIYEAAILRLLAQNETPVRLSSKLEGGQIVLSWPGTATGYSVRDSSELVSWTPVTVTPILENGSWVVRISASGVKTFYRLEK